ncbi:MAG TPA: sulfatase-like hydrolase/transferase [Verrucomicrobiae bacterium]
MSLKKWLPGLKLGVWIQLLPLLILYTLLWITAWEPFHLSLDTIKFWEYLIYGWTYAAAVYLLGLVVLTRYLRAWWLAAAFAWFYLLLYTVNGGFIHNMGTMLNPYFVWVVRPTAGFAYFADYITGWVLVLAIFFVVSGFLATWLIRRNKTTLMATPPWWLLLLAALCWLTPVLRDRGIFRPTAIAAEAVHAQLQGAWREDQTFSLRELVKNPVMILVRAVSSHRLKPLQPRPASDLVALADVLKKWHLPLGQRKYAPLGLKPFTRIVMFGTESLSLDFLAPYNKSLPPDLTPFYASLSNEMFVNYQCVALPTQPGLSVTFNSHPNVGGLLTSGYEASLIKYLDAQGYDTYFLMSGPETFLNDNILFKKIGFKHVIGSQTWLEDPRLAPFVEDRGLMDQKLYGLALDYLDANRDRKIFIKIMNCDTHSPTPRTVYDGLQYPPYPDSISKATDDPQAQTILRGIFRHDYDVGQTIKKMKERGLFTDDTLVIFTADHNFPHAEALNQIPGYPDTYFSRIPLAFLSGQTLPRADLRQLHSQLDFAPTIAHLLGLPIPPGWWGESIFAPDQNAPSVSKLGRNLIVTPLAGGSPQTISIDHPADAAETGLVTLFNSVYTNSPTIEAGTSAGSPTNSE